jgi:hypothetical protein
MVCHEDQDTQADPGEPRTKQQPVVHSLTRGEDATLSPSLIIEERGS